MVAPSSGAPVLFPASIDLASLDGTNGFILEGINSDDRSGRSVSGAGDVNGDGFDDVIIGAWGGIRDTSHVVFGHAGGFDATLDLVLLDGENGFRFSGDGDFDRTGWSVSGAGDINGDGFDDIITGSPRAGSRAGESYVVFGKAGGFPNTVRPSMLDGTAGFTLTGEADNDQAGWAVSGAGDVNGDGFDDLIIGAPFATPTSPFNDRAGKSYVVFGKATGFEPTFDLGSLDGENGFALRGNETTERSGWSVSGVGDVNGDGFDDIIIGAPTASPGQTLTGGTSYVVFGKASDFDPLVSLRTLDGSKGFSFSGVGRGEESGTSVSGAGDINGDGFADVIIGAPLASSPGGSAGQSYVVFGAAEGFLPAIDSDDLDGDNGFVISGIASRDNSGISVSAAGDINADGVDDIVVGALDANGLGPLSSGESYVLYGRTDGGFGSFFDLGDLDGSNGFVLNGIAWLDYSGESVSGAGDFNGDGVDDLLIGASGADSTPRRDEGESYIVFGRRVPEPATALCPVLAGTLSSIWRRRRTHVSSQ
ncbi:MAG: integrin alpha [Planctomycetota bacterium]